MFVPASFVTMTKKLSPPLTSKARAGLRKKLGVREQCRRQAEQVERERELMELVERDMKTRSALMRGWDLPLDPFLVVKDFDTSALHTELAPNLMPRWRELGEYGKTHLAFVLTAMFAGHSFTANVTPELEARWTEGGMDVTERLRNRLDRALRRRGLLNPLYFFVVEGRSRSGRSRTKLHMHGFLVTEEPTDATRFKLALEEATADNRNQGKGRRGAIHIPRAYHEKGVGRWPAYILKNVTKRDQRIPGRRVYMSQELTATVRELWLYMRGEPKLD